MQKLFIRILIVTVIVIVAATAVPSSRAMADAVWINGSPVFRSDIMRQKRLIERRREMRRRQYQTVFPVYMTGGPRPDIAPSAPPMASLRKSEKAGTVIIDTYGRRLFYVLPNRRAFVYPISVGRRGFTWTGTKKISRIASWPDWNPPPEMRLREPGLPKKMTGGIRNPLGAEPAPEICTGR